jgi:multidrug efflux system outer membrane protein
MGVKAGLSLRPVLILSVVLSIVGCSTTSPESRMGEVAEMAPGRWSASKEARSGVDHHWIARFGDSTLNALVEEGLLNNYDLAVAAERVNQAGSTAKLAGVSMRPTANATFDGNRQKRQFIGFPGGGSGATDSSYGTSVDVTWELDLWGRIRAGQSAEVAAFQAEGQNYRAARSSFAAQLAKAWFALAEANEQILLAATEVDVREKTESAIGDRFELALSQEGGSAAELRLAQSDTESARASMERWRGERDRSLREVEVLVGRYPSGKNLSKAGLPKIPKRPPAGLPSDLLMRRPDILAAERQFAGAGQRLREAELAVYPSLTLTGSFGTSSTELGDLLKSDAGAWTLGAGVLQPILTGGQIKYEQEMRESVERQRLVELQKAVLGAFGEVESALAAETILARRVEATVKAARYGREAAVAAQNDFAEGSGDVLTLLAAQSRRISTASALATLRRTQLDNRVNLHLALGGDFQVRKK